jgi:hypothetical protein
MVIGLLVVLLLGTAFAVLRVKFEGEDLGDNIASILNKRMRGSIAIGSIEWEPKALKKLVTGGWVPVTVRDIKVWDDCALSAVTRVDVDDLRTSDPKEDCTPDDRPDPDPKSVRKPRKQLLRAPLITAEIDIHALMFGNHDFVFRAVTIHPGAEALIEETREPYPLHAYDRVIVSIVTAFYPRLRAGFRAGITAEAPPPIFDIRDIHIRDLNLTIHMKPYSVKGDDQMGYTFAARLEGVNVDADGLGEKDGRGTQSYLYMDPTDPLIAKFYVRLAVGAKKGAIRILDEGPRAAFRMPFAGPTMTPESYPPAGRNAGYALDLVDVKLNRLAQVPTEWPKRDFVANTLELDLEATALPCPTPEQANPNVKDAAQLHLTGELHNYWDRPYDGSWNLKLDGKNLGPVVRTCIKSTAGGDNLDGTITLTGPFVASPKVGLDLKNLDVDVSLGAKEEPLRLTLAEVHGAIDLVNEQGFIDKTKALIRGGKEPGEVEVSATFGLKPMNANAQIEIAKAIDVGRFLPGRIATNVGRFLKGRLRARGDVAEGFALEEFDLSLGTTPTNSVIRVHKGRLFTDDEFDTIHVEKVYVNAGKSNAMFDGSVDILHGDLDLRVEGTFPDLDVWLKEFELPAFVQSAGGGSVIIIKGPINKPRINITTSLAGVPCIDTLRLVDTQIADGVLDIRRMTSAGLGGEISGSGRIRIDGPTPYIERLTLSGRRIEASKLCGLGNTIKGTLDTVELELSKATVDKTRAPIDWLDYAKIYAKAPKLSIKGDPYSDVSICVNRTDDTQCRPRAHYVSPEDLKKCSDAKRSGGACIVTTAKRDSGGILDATIAKAAGSAKPVRGAAKTNTLGGALSVDLPLAIIDQFVGKRIIGGDSRMTLHLGGTPTAPVAEGQVTLLRMWLANAFIGDAQLRVQPITLPSGKPGVWISGKAMADRVLIEGTMGTTAPFPVELSISGRRVEIDAAMDLTKLLGMPEPVQAWVSGKITVKTELLPVRPVEPEAWIELDEVVAIVNHRSTDGRMVPLRLSVIDQQPGARPAVSIRATPSSIELACKNPAAPGGREPCTTKVATPAGVITIRGHAAPSSVAIEADGTLDLALIAPLLDTRFDEASGTVHLAASVSGTFATPSYEAAIDLDPNGIWKNDPKSANPVRLRPVGGETMLEAPTGLIKLANGSLGFTDVIVQVRDQHLDEKGELHVKGSIRLDGFTPADWGLLISGKLAGKMLLVAVPGFVSQAGGLATIDGDLILSGKGSMPLVSGSLSFDPPADNPKLRPISLIPRGVRREVSFTSGSIDIETTVASDLRRTYALAINDIRASIDGEGSLSNISGKVEVRDGILTSLDVSLDADNIPFRLPGSLDLVISARDVQLAKSQFSELAVRGNVSIIDGTYLRNFELTDQIRSIGTTSAPSKPFWEEYPTLGNADLRLTLDVRRFAVRNNIAQIELVGPLIEITNTPRDPHMSGSIRIERGEFRIPGTRARFTRTTGSVDFSENRKAGDPDLTVTSEAPDFRDQSGQEHLITLSITGPLSNPQWDLKTSTGYNKSQTLSLLVLGRNQESLRRSLGDQSLGADPQNIDPTTNPSQGFADQIVKDLAGDWVSGLLGDSLGKITNVDVLRIEIGFGSIGLRLEKRILENLRIIGDAEQTLRGATYSARIELSTPYRFRRGGRVSAQIGYLNKNFADPAELDIVDTSVKLVLPLFIP